MPMVIELNLIEWEKNLLYFYLLICDNNVILYEPIFSQEPIPLFCMCF